MNNSSIILQKRFSSWKQVNHTIAAFVAKFPLISTALKFRRATTLLCCHFFLSSTLVPSDSAPAVQAGFIGDSRDARGVRHLTTSTSPRGIHAVDESHNCPLVILLLALSWGMKVLNYQHDYDLSVFTLHPHWLFPPSENFCGDVYLWKLFCLLSYCALFLSFIKVFC